MNFLKKSLPSLKTMKSSYSQLLAVAALASLLSCSTASVSHAQDAVNLEAESKEVREITLKSGNAMMEALDEETRTKFIEAMREGSQFLAEKRVQEALDKLTDAEIILPDHPDVLNLKGSVFVNIRAFDRAAEYFDRVKELYPGMWQTDFNRVEMDFVRDDWSTAVKKFEKILTEHGEKMDANTLRLIDFKIAICHLKLEQPAKAKNVIEKYGYYDATPIFYYGNAAMAFQEGNDAGAAEWIRNAKEIYPPQQNAIFEDSLFEAGWLLML